MDAIAWLNLNDGWGSFTAAQRMPGADSVVEMVWYRGGPVVLAEPNTRKRHARYSWRIKTMASQRFGWSVTGSH